MSTPRWKRLSIHLKDTWSSYRSLRFEFQEALYKLEDRYYQACTFINTPNRPGCLDVFEALGYLVALGVLTAAAVVGYSYQSEIAINAVAPMLMLFPSAILLVSLGMLSAQACRYARLIKLYEALLQDKAAMGYLRLLLQQEEAQSRGAGEAGNPWP